jgi:hypothetical protein
MSVEVMKQALDALELALSSHGVMLLSDPPQDAWKTRKVESKSQEAITALRAAIEQAEKPTDQIAPQREWAWMPAPIKTQWGHDMVVADLAIDTDHTVSIFCERDQIKSVEAMFAPQPQQVEKPVAWTTLTEIDWANRHHGKAGSFWAIPNDPTKEIALYAAPRQEQYDQTSLELCGECGWRALIPGDGCLVCARQKAKPVWIPRVHLEAAQREPSMCRVEPTKRLPDFVPLYTEPPAAPKPYRRGTYVRCMESDELCRVYTTSIDGGVWVRWPDGSITTYTAEQMGQAFSLEQAAPGKPVAYVDERIHGWPDCFVMEPDPPHTVPLYTEPREWVGLTDEENDELSRTMVKGDRSVNWLVDAIEAKLKEKNAA